ncbi:MAG: DNA-protecting protein DprA [Desulfovibrionaceae bacterium]|jgi:DNA processing protein|nr:DNA-protecting protein DprA [Desulfovibrionaceae bacterium]
MAPSSRRTNPAPARAADRPADPAASPLSVAVAAEAASRADRRTEFWACLALRHTPGLGPKLCKRLLERFGTAHEAVRASSSWTALKLVPAKAATAFAADAWRAGARREWDTVLAAGWEVLCHADPRYPELLRHIPDPPLLLYALGDLTLLKGPAVGIVGARRCTQHGRRAAWRIAAGLSRAGVTVVSGMAWGIDREAHLGALEAVGSSIGVLGTGLDLVYPSGNRDLWLRMAASGLLVTEFAPGTRPLAHNFPQRNRIISGLSRAVVVAEAPQKSGGLITARHALEADREVFAVPGPPGNPAFAGCADLVAQGARAVYEAGDVLGELAESLRAENPRGGVPKAPGGPLLRRLGAPPVWALAAAARRIAAGETAASRVVPGGALFPAAARKAEPVLAESGLAESVVSESPTPGAFVVPAQPPAPAPISAPVSANATGPDESMTLDESMTTDERAALAALREAGRLQIDALGRALGWEPQRVSGALLLLEMHGRVRQWPGMVYSPA